MTRHPNVVHEESVAWEEKEHGGRFRIRRRTLAAAAGRERLGCSLYEIPPGARSFPYHWHAANEEGIYVLEGSGTLRLDGREVPVSKGDYVALLTGPRGVHQVINSSGGVLRYLCFSTMVEPDVAVYPDSGKVGIFAGSAPGGDREKRTLQKYLKGDAEVGYWVGE